MTVEQTLLYGIGATKAGTSWLYRYLSVHPECAMPFPKEMHYFDTLEFGVRQGLIDNLVAQRDALRMLGAPAKWQGRNLAALEAYLPVLQNRSEDLSDYLAFLNRDANGKHVVGDITPAYALLPEMRLRQMADAAPLTRFVYILRDPVDRLWSHIRMIARRKSQRTGEAVEQAVEQILHKLENGRETAIMLRSDYAGALQRLFRVVPKAEVFVEFYERLFTPAAIQRLCVFLGISYQPGDFETRVHEGAPMVLSNAMRANLQHLMAPQYAAVAAQFDDLPDAWQRNMVTA